MVAGVVLPYCFTHLHTSCGPSNNARRGLGVCIGMHVLLREPPLPRTGLYSTQGALASYFREPLPNLYISSSHKVPP